VSCDSLRPLIQRLSVTSKYAFSVQNLIHNKTRNRLQPACTNKLAFVYLNSCVLHKINSYAIDDWNAVDFGSKSIDDLTAEEKLASENIFLACENPDDGDAISKTELSDSFDNKESSWLEWDDDDENA